MQYEPRNLLCDFHMDTKPYNPVLICIVPKIIWGGETVLHETPKSSAESERERERAGLPLKALHVCHPGRREEPSRRWVAMITQLSTGQEIPIIKVAPYWALCASLDALSRSLSFNSVLSNHKTKWVTESALVNKPVPWQIGDRRVWYRCRTCYRNEHKLQGRI